MKRRAVAELAKLETAARGPAKTGKRKGTKKGARDGHRDRNLKSNQFSQINAGMYVFVRPSKVFVDEGMKSSFIESKHWKGSDNPFWFNVLKVNRDTAIVENPATYGALYCKLEDVQDYGDYEEMMEAIGRRGD